MKYKRLVLLIVACVALFFALRATRVFPPNYVLLEAAGAGNTTLAKWMIALGANINIRGSSWDRGETPLHRAVGYEDTVEMLLANGAKVNARTEEGLTPLAYAALNGYLQVADSLIKRGADVNARSRRGDSALMLAAREGHFQVVRRLLDANATSKFQDEMGKTAADHARQRGHWQVVSLLETKDPALNQ